MEKIWKAMQLLPKRRLLSTKRIIETATDSSAAGDTAIISTEEENAVREELRGLQGAHDLAHSVIHLCDHGRIGLSLCGNLIISTFGTAVFLEAFEWSLLSQPADAHGDSHIRKISSGHPRLGLPAACTQLLTSAALPAKEREQTA